MKTFAIYAVPCCVLLAGCASTSAPVYFQSAEREVIETPSSTREAPKPVDTEQPARAIFDWGKVDPHFMQSGLGLSRETRRWFSSGEGLEGARPALDALADAIDSAPARVGRRLTARSTAEIRAHAAALSKSSGEGAARYELKLALRAATEALATEDILGAYGSSPDVAQRVLELRRRVDAIPEERVVYGSRMYASNALFAAVDVVRSLEWVLAATSASTPSAPPATP